jgi:hypothetical protein
MHPNAAALVGTFDVEKRLLLRFVMIAHSGPNFLRMLD